MDLRKTFECGQCFRWNALPGADGSYIGVFRGRLLIASRTSANIRLHEVVEGASVQNVGLSRESLLRYFDLYSDYRRIGEEICLEADSRQDSFLRSATEYSSGLRILRQDPFETLISFIISANNNIPKIKLTVEDLCAEFGDLAGIHEGKHYYAFPTAEQLAGRHAEIEKVRAIGYRAKAVAEAAEKVADGRLDLEKIKQGRADFETAVGTLRTLYGVGEKVANCVALFGLGHIEGFPVDTWIKKAMREHYGIEKNYENFVKMNFKSYPGIAQQYLFFYLRERKKTFGAELVL